MALSFVSSFNGLMEEFDVCWHNPPVKALDEKIREWGLDLMDAMV